MKSKKARNLQHETDEALKAIRASLTNPKKVEKFEKRLERFMRARQELDNLIEIAKEACYAESTRKIIQNENPTNHH